MVPQGFKFSPTDEELIQILDGKVSGGPETPPHVIVQANVYKHEPQDLEWNQAVALSNNERYYYSKKEDGSREVMGRGWWKATSHVKRVHANARLVGYKRPLTFHKFKDNNRNRNNAIKTNWIMHEYSLESRATDWRLCKIKYKGKPSLQEEMENMRQSYSTRDNAKASSSSSAMTQVGFPGEQGKQAHPHDLLRTSNSPVSTEWNMKHLQQPTLEPHLSGFDPFLPHNLYSIGKYPAVGQQEQSEFLEQPFPCLWSWQN